MQMAEPNRDPRGRRDMLSLCLCGAETTEDESEIVAAGTMKFRVSDGLRLSRREQRLLEWLCEQHQSGRDCLVFQTRGQDDDICLKQLQMSPCEVETVARRLESWGREHCDVDHNNSGTSPVRVECEGDEIRLVLLPSIVDFLSAYNAWLEGQEPEQG